jgi:hypothetical protein
MLLETLENRHSYTQRITERWSHFIVFHERMLFNREEKQPGEILICVHVILFRAHAYWDMSEREHSCHKRENLSL